MLNIEEASTLLGHNDRDVRHRVAEFLRAHPLLTPKVSDAFWESYDRYGIEESGISYVYPELPQSPAACRRVLGALGGKPSKAIGHWLRRAFDRLPLEFVESNQEEVLRIAGNLPPEEALSWKRRRREMSHAEHLARRLELKTAQAEELWAELVQFCGRIERLSRSEWDWREDFRLTEALARHPQFTLERCLAELQRPERTWLGVFAMELLLLLRQQPSLQSLIDRLDDPLSCEYELAIRLLAQRDGEESLQALLKEFTRLKGEPRTHLLGTIGKLRSPAAERELITLLDSKTLDEEETDHAAQALVDLFTTEGIEHLRGLAISGQFDQGFSDLREDVLILGAALGREIPEEKEWWNQIESDREAWTAFSPMQRVARLTGRSPVDSAPSLLAPADMPAPTVKIGRNDPCPCGSGKKYKKCCLNND